MAGYIRHFQTISKYQASLQQPPTTISCLANVLKYIKEVLDDDNTQALVSVIQQHFARKHDAHYVNLELLSYQILAALQLAFVNIGLYTNERATLDQYNYFFKEIYDGRGDYEDVRFIQTPSIYDQAEIIPTDFKNFTQWLLANPEIYLDEVPEDYDSFRIGLTLVLANEWFNEHHNQLIDAHSATIASKLDQLISTSKIRASYCFIPKNFITAPYCLLAADDYTKLMLLLSNRLIAMGNPVTVDYNTYADTSTILHYGYTDSIIQENVFMSEIYDTLTPEGVTLLQLDTTSIYALYDSGDVSLSGYPELLSDCGETGGVVGRKFIDYYSNHLDYVLAPEMSPAYRDTLTSLRSSVNTNYSKVFFVYTVLNKKSYGINVTVSLSKLVKERTLDLINIIGLSKSVCCLSLVPYQDNTNKDLNKIVLAFDNYNPNFSVTLADNLSEGDMTELNLLISTSRSTIDIFYTLDGIMKTFQISNIGKMFDVDPFFLFVVPKIADALRGTNRITNLRLYGQALDQSDAMAIISGFQHM